MRIAALFVAVLTTAAMPPAGNSAPATTIYSGGKIVTMNPAQPSAEAVVVQDGRIVAVGSAADARRDHADAELVDLAGKTLLPGFIDGHSHFSQAAISLSWVNVSPPPISSGADAKSVVDLLKNSAAYKAVLAARAAGNANAILMGFGYDDSIASMPCYDSSSTPCRRGLTHDDLDAAFADIPVILVHVSMHGGLLNKAALTTSFGGKPAIGLAPTSPLYADSQRKPAPNDKELVGILMETPWLALVSSLPPITQDAFSASLDGAQQLYASYGYTTLHDSPIDPNILPLYFVAAGQKKLYLDLVGYSDPVTFFQPAILQTDFRGPYANHFRLAGVKTIVDGSPQARTALFQQPYVGTGPSGLPFWRGNPPSTNQQELSVLLSTAYQHKAQVLAHINGDAAVEMLLIAHRDAGAPKGMRTTPIHAQFVNPAQLAQFAEYEFTPSFFTAHAYYWGDIHRINLGSKRADFLSPMKSGNRLGLHMTNHSDFIVTPPDPLFILWSSLRRVSRSGAVIGASERLTPAEGLKALTADGAYQYFEETTKGTLAPGKVADFVILDGNPLEMADRPDDILRIAVLQTVKDGKTVFTCATPCAPRRAVDLILAGMKK
ncbi:hypothetical protein DFR29_12345 [Tahibacter aquaticus]|uniref:Uncharacterized protein n=1 Tax=Tahibacter aquaticus TaxID=520092 RepID=A0A4R6YKY9_9GAMM|nr:amidohydrolase [Tahibacter aquaticus]TDR37871.1 hypothetical protein DFR29_12345 [Tahibacter aquaticus]